MGNDVYKGLKVGAASVTAAAVLGFGIPAAYAEDPADQGTSEQTNAQTVDTQTADTQPAQDSGSGDQANQQIKQTDNQATDQPTETNQSDDQTADDNTDVDVQTDADVTADVPFAGATGSGAESDPYLINDPAAFTSFRDSVNNKTENSTPNRPYFRKYVKLNADIDLGNEEWTPIHDFAGSFDGAGHTVSNLKVTKATSVTDGKYTFGGLFGTVNNLYFVDANNQQVPAIQNLTVENADVTGVTRAAGIVANLMDTSIVNAHVKGSVTIKSTGLSSSYAGGIVAHAYGNITNCSVTQTGGNGISGIKKVGGLAGYIGENGYTVSGNTVTGVSVSATLSDAGGLIGAAQGNATITGNSVADATVSGSKSSTAGLVGRLVDTAGGTVQNNAVKNAALPKGGYALVADYGAGAGRAPAEGKFTVDGNLTAAVTGATASEADEITGNVAVAQVGGEYYTSIADALAKAGANGTVTLIADTAESVVVPADATVTIDLNGHKLTNEDGKHTIVNKGTLTVTDSSEAKSGTVDNVSHSKAAVVNYGGATAILAGGNYTRSAEASTYDPATDKANSGGNSYYVLKNFGTMTVKDPSVVKFSDTNTGMSSSLVANGWYSSSDNDGDATVNAYGANGGATFTLEGGTLTGGKITVKNDDWGTFTMTGGTITQPVENFYAVLTYHKANITGGAITAPLFPIGASGIRGAKGDVGETTIGGNVTVVSAKGYALRALDNGKITVTGGTFTSGNQQGVSDLKPSGNGTPSVSISGGTFNVKPTESELAKDYVVNDNGDGTFGAKLHVAAIVTKTDGAATEYKTLAEAVAAAGDGDVITLQDDTAEKIVISGKTNLTVNGNGHAMSGTIEFSSTKGSNNGVTVEGVRFTGTGAPLINVNGSGNKNIALKSNTFDLTSAGWVVIYVQKTSDGLTIEDNTFNMPKITSGTAQVIGFAGTADARATNVTIKGNVLNGNADSTGGSVFFVMGWTAATNGEYGVTNLTIESNTVNASGSAAVYGAWLRNVDTVTVRGNTFAGTVGVGLTSGLGQAANKNITVEGNTSTAKYGLYVNDDSLEGGILTKDNTGMSYAPAQLPAGIAHADGSFSYYQTLAEAFDASVDGEIVKILNDATLDADAIVTKNVALDVNGKKVDTAGFTFDVKDGGKLTVTGNGTMSNSVAADEDDDDLHAMFNVDKGGTLSIENGTYKGTGAPAASVEGTLTVNGGDFSVTKAAIFVLPKADDASLTVNGGTYKDATVAISALAGTNKLAITGGDFDVNPASFDQDQAYTKYITGGTYAKNPGQSTIADDKKFITNDAGRYVIADATIASVETPADITVEAGTDPTGKLLSTVKVTLDNGLTRDGVTVDWEDMPNTWQGPKGGTITLVGIVDGQDNVKVTQTIIVNHATITSATIDTTELSTPAGVDPTDQLPKQATIVWSSGNSDTQTVDVVWDEIKPGDFAKPGDFDVKGMVNVDGYKASVTVKVTVGNAVATKVELTETTVDTIATNSPDAKLGKVKAKVTWSDGATTDEDVTWPAIDADQYAAEGSFEVTGTVKGVQIDGRDATITVTVNVAARVITTVTPSDARIEVETAGDTDPKPDVTGKATLTWNDGKTSTVEVPLTLPDDWNHPRTAHDVAVSGRVDGWNAGIPFTVHVKAAAATGVTASGVSTEEKVAPVLPETAAVTWSNGETSAEKIEWPTIDADQYAAEGSFEVTGTVKGVQIDGKDATVTITVTVTAATITGVDNPTDTVVTASGTKPVLPATLTAHWSNGTDSQVSVTWAESDKYTALAGGDYTLTGTVAGWDGKVSIKVHVTPATPVKLANDGKVEVTTKTGVAPELPAKLDVVWSNGDKVAATVAWNDIDSALLGKVGTFTATGTVTVPSDASGLVEGTAETTTRTFPVTATVTVEAVPVTSVTVAVDSADLAIGGTAKATATIKPGNATDQKVTWTSSNEKVAAVDANGNVKALAEGTAEITATAGGVTSKAVKVTVTNVAVKVEPTASSVDTIATNKPDLSKVKATVAWSDGTTTTEAVEWETIDADQYAAAGRFDVTGIVRGITVDGKKATVTITVNVAARVITAVTPSDESIEVATAADADPKPTVTGKATLTWNDGKTSTVDVALTLPDGWNHPRTAHDVAVTGRVDGWNSDVPFTVQVKAAKVTGAADPAGVSTLEKVAPVLPQTAVVTWSNGETSSEAITWDAYDEAKLSQAGEFTVTGSVKGQSVSVTVTVIAAAITGVDSPADPVTTASGEAPDLPATLTAHWSNGTDSQVGVTWVESDAYKALAGGDYELKGTVAGWEGEVSIQVHVTPATPSKLANDGAIEVATKVGVMPQLPAETDVVWSNGDTLAAAVVWNDIDAALLAKAGTFTVSGTVTVPADASGIAAAADAEESQTVTFTITATVTVSADSTTNPDDGKDDGNDDGKDDTDKGNDKTDNNGSAAKPNKTPLSSTGVAVGGIAGVSTLMAFLAGIALSLSRKRR
ncbi:Ig-like domain-containing protein [Bifidobacterium olomucense]|uniref:Bacterial Ig-like domain (Group 4) n=1 Tax=Bifidobacterium olomucense TaxID=2675324 RepID=A0A7Y0EXR8_9BIFI|nr:Ig-like domain-containing protein [Bifidobacterium sp. DSM 109959]NMM98319.1 Bacterial Ig-like domain (group 4) [Bifidobacterium sp. DSM 109959]